MPKIKYMYNMFNQPIETLYACEKHDNWAADINGKCEECFKEGHPRFYWFCYILTIIATFCLLGSCAAILIHADKF